MTLSKMFNLAGRVAIVTGGNGGIGLGMARGLASHGATIVVAGRKTAKSEAAAKELAGLGAKATVFTVDVKDEGQVKAMVADTVKRHG
ncbi:MAG: SDR family NAD(P)-dependent oxidoreductase, partial [Alphaproteobacteria bacterium]|nr:SDR family NAD(P)-dependent oxidoreductase [Alphaproteobacteria bacterium]